MNYYTCLNCNNEVLKDFDTENMICKRCGSNNIVRIPGDMTVSEEETIYSISKEKGFVQAMIDLRENDPIEYQLKMSQFKANLNQQKIGEQKTDNTPHCPTCNSTDIKKISATAKLTNIAMFGLLGNKRKKTFHCNKCGYEW